jgi:GIY-YIG catalytic domain
LVHTKSVQLSIESSHNTTSTQNSLISAQPFSITNTTVLHRFPHFTLQTSMERIFEEDENDLYVEDFHENDDSDDTYSDSVVDEVNENEADDAEDDHAETNPVSKTFAAVQRHYEPLVFGPERLFESSKLQFKNRTVPNSRQHQGEAIIETIRFATRKLHPDGQIEYILFKCHPPHNPSTMLTEAVDRALNAFARLSNGYLHLPMSLALMENDSVREILHSGIETAKFFFQTLSDFAASFLNRVLRGETLSLSMPEKAEIKAYNSKLGTAGGTYLVLTTNKNNEVAGVYVGRTNSLQRRMKDHQINLAIATHTSDSFAHIESHFYQSAARELHYGGEMYFIPANIFPITSQGEFLLNFFAELNRFLLTRTFHYNRNRRT